MFSRQLHLDQHRLLGAHDYGNRSIGMENVKHLFAEKIKQSSHFLTNPGCFNPITTNENDVTPTPKTRLLKKKRLGNPKMEKIPLFRKTETNCDAIL